MATSKKEQEVIRSLIEMYKNMPYLWRRDNKDYTNKEVREEGYKVLLDIYQDWDEDCTMPTVKKKIDNLRSNYLKELKKVRASEVAGDDEVYVPTLWYFDLLSFLNSRKGSEEEYGFSSRDPLGNEKPKTQQEDTDVSINSSIRKRKLNRTLLEKRLHPSESAKKFIPSFQRKDEPWETTYGKSIGHQMKDLKGPQLVICQKLISDAIFYAKLDKLNEHSQIVNAETETTYLEPSYVDSD